MLTNDPRPPLCPQCHGDLIFAEGRRRCGTCGCPEDLAAHLRARQAPPARQETLRVKMSDFDGAHEPAPEQPLRPPTTTKQKAR